MPAVLEFVGAWAGIFVLVLFKTRSGGNADVGADAFSETVGFILSRPRTLTPVRLAAGVSYLAAEAVGWSFDPVVV